MVTAEELFCKVFVKHQMGERCDFIAILLLWADLMQESERDRRKMLQTGLYEMDDGRYGFEKMPWHDYVGITQRTCIYMLNILYFLFRVPIAS